MAGAGLDVGDVGEVDDAFGVVGFVGLGLPCFHGEGEGRPWGVRVISLGLGCWDGGDEEGEGGESGE